MQINSLLNYSFAKHVFVQSKNDQYSIYKPHKRYNTTLFKAVS